MANRVQIPFSFNYPSGGNLLPAAGASVAVYFRNVDGSQGATAPVYQSQAGSSQYSSITTDTGGNVPGWVSEGTYKIVAAASGGFGGGVINFDALYGGGTSLIAPLAVDVPQLSTAVQTSLVPPGTILDHGGTAAPSGFLACDGSTVSQTTYAALYSAISTNWNTGGEAGGTFRLPNLIGAMTIGRGTASWGTTRTLGKYGLPSGGTYLGEESHVVTAAEMPVHNHGVSDPSHAHGISDPAHGHSVYDPGHAHSYIMGSAAATFNFGSQFTTHGQGGVDTGGSGTGIGIYGAYTGIGINGAYTGIGINNAGGGASHNNMPPFAVVNKIIKY